MTEFNETRAADILYGAPAEQQPAQQPAEQPSLAGGAPAEPKTAEDTFYAPSEKTVADLYYKNLARDEGLAEFVSSNSDGEDVSEVHQRLGEQLHTLNVTAAEASVFIGEYNRAQRLSDAEFTQRERAFLDHANRQDQSYRDSLQQAAGLIEQTWGAQWLAALRDSGALYQPHMADRLVELARRHARAKVGM